MFFLFVCCLFVGAEHGDDHRQAAEYFNASGLSYVRQPHVARRIFPDKPGHDQHTYECPRGADEITEIVQFEKAEAFH